MALASRRGRTTSRAVPSTTKPAQPIPAPDSVDQPATPPTRLKHTPIEIGCGGVT
jgi:hypothetical protein